VVMFALGIAARRGDWLRQVSDRFAFTVAGSCVGVAMLGWLPMLVLGGALKPDGFAPFSGGLTWQSAALATWEQLICVGMSFGVVAGFRRWVAGAGRFNRFMSDNAFAVYVIHAPILVALAVLAAPIALPPLAKFVALWAAGALVTFGVAAPLARRIPVVGRILQ
jgi:glucan biosynthesis protein C